MLKMDFIDELKQFSSLVEKNKLNAKTEEATKTALILPFFQQILGYDIFDPSEFVPEFTADVGIKKGEKVDYAIVKQGDPIILIEAKWCGEDLQKHDSQLFRYFGTTTARFGILTNGIIYKIYTDLEAPHRMDSEPFLEFSVLDIKESLVPEIKKFHKSNFNIETIVNTASELKYSSQIKQLMSLQLSNPTDGFINYVLSEIYSGKKTQNVVDKFRSIVKKSLNQFVNEVMNDKFKSVLEKPQEDARPEPNGTQTVESVKSGPSRINTTEEELEGFFIIKSLLREIVPPNLISYKDAESYFVILFDNNSWKWICRLSLGEGQKAIIIPDENKKPVKYSLVSIDDIYNYKVKLHEVVRRYL